MLLSISGTAPLFALEWNLELELMMVLEILVKQIRFLINPMIGDWIGMIGHKLILHSINLC